ncbi:MAG: hypothetical protein M3167_07950 [Acidobacteriota bacterium]|nr:hypothetical protein [Acidobacteriota bacterium]
MLPVEGAVVYVDPEPGVVEYPGVVCVPIVRLGVESMRGLVGVDSMLGC